MKPYNTDKIDARFQLEIGEQRITYSYGPKFWKDVSWSDEEESRRVRIVFEDLDENRHDKSFDGPWAWFKLQDRSKLSKTKQSNVYLVTYTVSENAGGQAEINHKIKYLIKAKSVNNPFSQNLLGAFKCPESI